ncbi:MAG: sigma-70 family RNA polymerase sigma factor [Clostridia bacterium]|nr:sigma-70 family RNA polymerase sigma factor [Clostridia bacterium]
MADFEKLYREFYPQVYAYLVKLTGNHSLAEELTQETFFRVFRSIDSYRGDCRFGVWACGIAKNAYYSYLKKNRRLTGFPAEIADEGPSFDDRIADRELSKKVIAALDGIAEPYRGVFRQRVFEELPFAAIAQRAGKTESWARVTFHRAKNMIRELIE